MKEDIGIDSDIRGHIIFLRFATKMLMMIMDLMHETVCYRLHVVDK